MAAAYTPIPVPDGRLAGESPGTDGYIPAPGSILIDGKLPQLDVEAWVLDCNTFDPGRIPEPAGKLPAEAVNIHDVPTSACRRGRVLNVVSEPGVKLLRLSPAPATVIMKGKTVHRRRNMIPK